MSTLSKHFASRTLTDWQLAGLNNPYSLSNSHAHYPLPTGIQRALAPLLLTADPDPAGETPQIAEQHFERVFFELAGQTPVPGADLALHYSASVSIDCVARALLASGRRRVALISPTCDNIPLLMRRCGLELVPLEEHRFWTQPAYRAGQFDACDAVFLVIPNNPTGFEPTRDALLQVTDEIAQRGLTLVIDFCFRFYSRLAAWNQYATIASGWPDLTAVFLEDTGKTWSLGGLKVGFSHALGQIRDPLREITREVLLNVSPFTLRLLTRLMTIDQEARRGGSIPYPRLISDRNREYLRRLLTSTPIDVEFNQSTLSVEWLKLPDDRASAVCEWLESQHVSVLPGNSFYWAGADTDRHIRIALSRSPEYFEAAADQLVGRLRQRYC